MPCTVASSGFPNGVISWDPKTLRDGNQLITSSLQLLDGEGNDSRNSGLVCLVVKSQEILRLLRDLLSVQGLGLASCLANRVARVEVPENQRLVPDSSSRADQVVIVPIRGTHESRGNAKNLLHCLFDSPHLVVDLIPSKGSQILVIPSMITDLMASLVGVLQIGGDARRVDAVVVVAVNEESSLGTVLGQKIRELFLVDVWTVVEGQCNLVRVLALCVNRGESTLLQQLDGGSGFGVSCSFRYRFGEGDRIDKGDERDEGGECGEFHDGEGVGGGKGRLND